MSSTVVRHAMGGQYKGEAHGFTGHEQATVCPCSVDELNPLEGVEGKALIPTKVSQHYAHIFLPCFLCPGRVGIRWFALFYSNLLSFQIFGQTTYWLMCSAFHVCLSFST